MPASPARVAAVRAPAKVNLFLKVLGRRPDGYHDIDTRMFPVSLYDDVGLEVASAKRPVVRCRVSGPERVAGGPSNLAARAARAVLDRLGESAAVSIRVHKRIPAGAGLGGGSSDAAAVIRVLPGLLGRRLDRAAAIETARELGADVPFFVAGRPARATGIGDRLAPIGRLPRGALVVGVPTERVETAWAYRSALKGLTSGRAVSRVRSFPCSIDAVESWFLNDFQRGVEGAFESVRRTRCALLALGARAAVLSGSGSAVAAIFEDAAAARRAVRTYEGPGRAFAVRILRRPPVAVRG